MPLTNLAPFSVSADFVKDVSLTFGVDKAGCVNGASSSRGQDEALEHPFYGLAIENELVTAPTQW